MAAKKPKSSLKEWREKHFAELEKDLEAWKEIRDNEATKIICPNCKHELLIKHDPKHRIEAAKNIHKALGGMTPERGSKSSSVSSASDTLKTTPEEDEMLGDILGKPTVS